MRYFRALTLSLLVLLALTTGCTQETRVEVDASPTGQIWHRHDANPASSPTEGEVQPEPPKPETERFSVIVEADPEGKARVSGSGTYSKGQKVVVEAEPEEGFVFAGWVDGRGNVRSFRKKFEFEVSEDTTLVAVLEHVENTQFEGFLPGILVNEERAVPQLSPDHRYLLGMQDGVLTLTRFPGNDVVRTFPAEEKHLVRGFKWAPWGDAFAYHTECEEPGGSGGVYLTKLDGSTEKVASVEPPDLGPRQMLWSPCGRYLFWDKPFSIYHRETGELLVRRDIDDRYSEVRSPLFSEDGSKLSFSLLRDDGSENLWVMDLHSGDIRQVTNAGEGDYPFCWVDDTTLLVRVGAVSTGGGLIYGLAAVDVETGARELVDYPSCGGPDDHPSRRINIVKGISPEKNYLIGESRSADGTDSRIYLLDLQSRRREVISEGETSSEGYGLLEVLWIKGEQVLLNARKESYDDVDHDSRDPYVVLQYSRGNGCLLLVESETQVRLLGIDDDTLYYLQLNKTGSHWSVRHRRLN